MSSPFFRSGAASPRLVPLFLVLLQLGILPFHPSAALSFDCLDDQGNLLDNQAIEDEACTSSEDVSFFYQIAIAPITSNGLQAGALSDLHLWFGNSNSPIETAFDPEQFGLAIPGKLIIDMGPQFIYDKVANRTPVPNQLVELGIAMGNAALGDPCVFQDDVDRAAISCAGWTAEFGDGNQNQIQYVTANNGTAGLQGGRGQLIGAKFAHIHSEVPGETGIYHNANGTCSSVDTVYCRFDSECAFGQVCVPTALITAAITATVLDADGSIIHKATQSVDFTTEPDYAVAATNAQLVVYRELAETVHFQHVFPDTLCENIERAGDLFSSSTPYAPRFLVMGPQSSDFSFPRPAVLGLEYDIDTDTTGTLRDGDSVIGTVELIQPQGAGAILTSNNAGRLNITTGRLGGTLLAVPVRVGNATGSYAVRITLNNGKVTDSRIVVDEPTMQPTVAASAMPSVTLSMAPSSAPSISQTPSSAPSIETSTVAGQPARQQSVAAMLAALVLLAQIWW